MFEYSDLDPGSLPPAGGMDADGVIAHGGTPVEFFYKGRAFHIHSLLTKWKESGQWWTNINQAGEITEGQKIYWKVEAAPVGTVNIFEIEFDLTTNTWNVRPASRAK